MGTENVRKVLGKLYDNEPPKKLTVFLRMFIRGNHSESSESCEDRKNHAGSDEKIVKVCGRSFAVPQKNKIQ